MPRIIGREARSLVSVRAKKCLKFTVNLLKPSGFFTYHQVQISKILHGARFALTVLYGYQNRQRLLLYTSLTDWLL